MQRIGAATSTAAKSFLSYNADFWRFCGGVAKWQAACIVKEASSAGRSLRILVLHSPSKKNRLIELFLKSEQADVVVDVSAAVNLLLSRHYDAIVVDLLNGSRDGASTVGQLRTKEEFAPILAIDSCRSFDD